MKAVAIVSGGLDSTVLAYHIKSFGDTPYLMSFNYGQRHVKELDSARAVAERLGAAHEVVDLSGIQHILSSSVLTDPEAEIPEGHYAADNMAATVVPNRNAIMLAIAYGWAVSLGANYVATGVHAGDHFIYPDCRPNFIKAFDLMEGIATEGFATSGLNLYAPFVHMTKSDIVKLGAGMNVPFEITWSCYKGRELHCSVCGTCAERREAFITAGVEDPTQYELSEEEFRHWFKEVAFR